MTKYNIDSDDPLEMVWAIRDKIREETKNMTREEYHAYIQSGCERVDRDIERIRRQKAADRAAGIPYKFPWE
ncbi:MAG: hypothetical protein ACRC10_03725 [Thermoguttaceae bacterium]